MEVHYLISSQSLKLSISCQKVPIYWFTDSSQWCGDFGKKIWQQERKKAV